MDEKMNVKLSSYFRCMVTTNNFLLLDKCVEGKYNLICTVMDRVDTCVLYLNKHGSVPKSEHEILVWFMYASILIDAISSLEKLTNIILKSLNIGRLDNKYSTKLKYLECKNLTEIKPYEYFGEIYFKSKLFIGADECETDDVFFKYLRSLSMAHPFETSRPKFLKAKNLTHYSPFPISGVSLGTASRSGGNIGFMIYNGNGKEPIILKIPFEVLEKYIQSRYIQFVEILKAFECIAQKIEEEEKKRIQRNVSDPEILSEISKTLDRRKCVLVAGSVRELKDNLTTKLTIHRKYNEQNVEKYRAIISQLVPELCDAIDQIDYEKLECVLNKMKYNGRSHYPLEYYDLGKIQNFFDISKRNTANYFVAKSCAKNYYNKFAEKWIKIDFDKMDEKEILLLFRVAGYLG